MTTREKRLAVLVAGVAGIGVVYQLVWPRLKAAFDLGEEIATLEKDLDEALEKRDEIDDALMTYKDLVSRTGSRDSLEVKNSVHKRLQELALAAEFPTPRITPRSPTSDRKTGIDTVSVGINGEGTLQEVLTFLTKCYELPYVTAFKDIKLSPAGSRNDTGKVDKVSLQSTLEVKVLPKHDLAERLTDNQLEQPESVVKHEGESYAMIWDRDPFSEFQEPPRPVKQAPVVAPIDNPSKDNTPPAPPALPKITSDPDARDKKLVLASRVKGEDVGVGEVLVLHTKRNTREYVGTGEKLDEGELLFVHPYGAFVRKDDGDYFYEVGHMLSDPTNVNDIHNYPEIERLAMLLPPREAFNEEAARDGMGDTNEGGRGEAGRGADNPRWTPPPPTRSRSTATRQLTSQPAGSRANTSRRPVPVRGPATQEAGEPNNERSSRRAEFLRSRQGRRGGRISLTPASERVDEKLVYPPGTTREEAATQPARGVTGSRRSKRENQEN
jgi:hypothetical protein